ncbi:Uncharacterized protein YhaN [Desulfonispora thiosulfatigenes DSM 11270]|uniref:Uncharacterized protein YhaN n=1 Tax=Desulfonispora thiosulfatigenes DSM 11270 TaxID=656914 RepID=A0A1W1VAA7_DESTI|nr:AAA family ATPase [Desulfonispora thiosulfatigenes]SMB90288.1 Uncharacterized protein YhaN [Desulfonispora thiosulfatigenes DSM 11270]
MLLKKLKINSFGKLKDLEIEFSKGLNVIYGKNEAGKSTMQAFIKAMLYGMNSRKQDIRENDRKRYEPLNGDKASGELYYLDRDNNEYLIRKTFGSSKSYDRKEVINAITGKKVDQINADAPGVELLGIGEEAFERSLFIRQLGSEVSRDKKDELMNKLTNLHQSGDENVSYWTALNMLEEFKREYTTPRGMGKLDNISEEYSHLKQERISILRLHEENISDQLEVKNKEHQIAEITRQIKELDHKKTRLRQFKTYQEYENILKYYNQLEILLQQVKDAKLDLKFADLVVDETYIEKLKELDNEYRNLQERFKEVEEKNKELFSQKQEKEEKLKDFQGFDTFEEQIELKTHNVANEIKNITKNIEEINNLKVELDTQKEKLSKEREKLGSLIKLEQVNEKLESEIENNEQRINNLKQQLGSDAKLDNLELRKDIILEKANTNKLITFSGVALVIGGLIGGFFQNYIFILSILGLLLTGFGFSRKGNIAKDLHKIEEEIQRSKNDNEIHQEINILTKSLQEVYMELAVTGYQDFRLKMRQYNEHKTEIELLKNGIKAKENILVREDLEKLTKELTAHTEYIQSILLTSKTEDIQEFTNKVQNYKDYLSELANIQDELAKSNAWVTEIKEKVKEKETALNTELAKVNEDSSDLLKINTIIQKLLEKLQRKNESERKFTSTKQTYEELLKVREISAIKDYVSSNTFTSEDELSFKNSNEEEIDKSKTAKNGELLACEKELRDLENKIKNRFSNTNTLDEIDEQLGDLEEKIKSYQQKIKVIDIAIANINKSFEEIQRSFGPKLNKQVGNILSKITLGKYSEIKISEDYDIKVIDPSSSSDLEVGYFSNGTWDQIYFALRLGIVNLIFDPEDSFPIILDDAFIQYDDLRLKAVLEYLYDYSKEKQCFLFTCRSREVECVKAYSDVNFITLKN